VISWFRKIIFSVLATALVVSGCLPLRLPTQVGAAGQQRQKKDLSATEPNIEPLVFMADYASDAIQATGGIDAWMKIDMLALDGVVTIYEGSRPRLRGDKLAPAEAGAGSQPDDSFYLTEHHFEVYPWSNSIRVSAQEPLSRFVWQLSPEQFSLLEGDKQLDVAPRVVTYRDYAEAVLNLITAPVRFLDEPVVFIKEPGPVKVEGLWYHPIARIYPVQPSGVPQASSPNSKQEDIKTVQPYWSKVVFFQNRDSSLVDMVWFADIDQNKFLAVRGYDYKPANGGEKGGVLVPTKIEIFTTDARAIVAERLVKIDFK